MTYASKMQDKVYDFRKKLSVYLYDHSSNQRDLVNEVAVDPDADEDVVIIDPSANSTKEYLCHFIKLSIKDVSSNQTKSKVWH